MPQEFQVLRCCNCEKFQVHHIKKAKKWNCKVCNEKQSFIKIYFIGSAPECRSIVQLNNLREGEKKAMQMLADKCDSTADNYVLSSKKIKLYDEKECFSSEFKSETDFWSDQYFENELSSPQNKYNHESQSTQEVIFQNTTDLLTEQFSESLENNHCKATTTGTEHEMQLSVKNASSNDIILQNKVETIEKLKKPTITKNMGFQKILAAAKRMS